MSQVVSNIWCTDCKRKQKVANQTTTVSVSLFNGISAFVGYLMPEPFSEKNSSGTI